MATPNTSTVSVNLVRMLQAYADFWDLEFNYFAEKCGFDVRLLSRGGAKIESGLFEQIWLSMAAEANDPFPGLNLGKLAAAHYPAESILFSMMNNCSTIGAALNVFIRYHRIMADNIQPVCRIVDGELFLSWDIKWFNFPVKNHLSEALLTTYYAILARLSNNAIIPERVMFTHEGPEESKSIKIYENWFRAPVEFRSKTNQLVLPSQALDIEIAFADEMMLAVLENYAEKLITQIPSRSVWTAEVIKLINQSFFSGAVPRINDIAGKLAVSTRSLQEKLKTEETCFRDLVNQVRKKNCNGSAVNG
jgi:hypothetical protein